MTNSCQTGRNLVNPVEKLPSQMLPFKHALPQQAMQQRVVFRVAFATFCCGTVVLLRGESCIATLLRRRPVGSQFRHFPQYSKHIRPLNFCLLADMRAMGPVYMSRRQKASLSEPESLQAARETFTAAKVQKLFPANDQFAGGTFTGVVERVDGKIAQEDGAVLRGIWYRIK